MVVILFIAIYWFYELAPLGITESRLDSEAASQQVTAVERGYNLYEANCARCHGANGEGGIGPTLNRQDKLFAHLSVDYLNNVLVVGGRYVCGNPNSLMPVWSNEGHPPGPLNYIQIEDLIAFIRAPSTETFTVRDPALGEPKVDPITGEVRTFKGWVDPAYKPAPGATPFPACWSDEFATPSGSPAASARLRRAHPRRRGRAVRFAGRLGSPAASVRPGRRQDHRLGHRVHDAGGHGPGRHAVRHRLRQPGCLDPAQRRDQGLDRGGQVQGRHLPRRRDEAVPGAGPRGRDVPLPVHGPPEHDGDPDRSVRSPPTSTVGGRGWRTMAQQALGAGTVLPRKRALFGLLDQDGWAWASVKAFAWLVIIILMLGYLPDRAYYLTVGRTVDLGVLVWSPINFCPPTNESLPCPAPVGAVIPWETSPAELNLPQPRTDGALLQVGTQILYIGGSDGTTAQSTVYVARTVGTGNFDKWAEGPKLPEPRADASVAYVAGSIYVIGGRDASGAPTTTVFVLSPDSQTGQLGEWSTAKDLALPEARAETASAITPDGLLIVGGRNADGPVATTLKTKLSSQGKLGAWSQEQPLVTPQAGATGVLIGDFLWLYGGSDATDRPTRSSAARSASPPPRDCRPIRTWAS